MGMDRWTDAQWYQLEVQAGMHSATERAVQRDEPAEAPQTPPAPQNAPKRAPIAENTWL
jgi:hypothetical protein